MLRRRQGRQGHPDQALQVRLEVRLRVAPALDHRAQRRDPQPAAQGAAGPLLAGLQEADLLAQPHQVPHEAGGLGSQRRAKHPEPRQEQVRAHLLGRGDRHHRRRDQAHPQGIRSARHPGPGRRPRREQDHPHAARPSGPPARHDGRLHPAGPQPGQLGRLVLGRQARLGPGLPGHDVAGRQPHQGHLRELRPGAQVGLRRGDHPLGLHRPVRQPHLPVLDPGRHQAGLHLPRPQLRRRRPRRQVDPGAAEHRRGPPTGRHLCVADRRHLGQGVRRHPRGGHGQDRGLRPGQGRGRHSQDPGVGVQEVRRARVDHQGPRPAVRQEHHVHHPLLRRLRLPRPVLARARPPGMRHAGHAGPRRSRRPSVPDDLLRHAEGGRAGKRPLLQPRPARAADQALLDHRPRLGPAADPQDPHPGRHPQSAAGLPRQRRPGVPDRRAVRPSTPTPSRRNRAAPAST